MPSQSSESITIASQAHAQGRFDEAERICRSILQSEPDLSTALLLLGITLAKRGKLEEAAPYLERVVAEDPGSFQAPLWLSITRRKLELASGALESAKIAVHRNPSDPQGQNQLGLCYIDTYQFEEAESAFRAALSKAPNVSVIHYGLGLAFQGQKMNAEAIAAFRKAAQLDPNSLTTQTTIRQLLMDELDPVGAADCARTILRLQPNSPEAHLWLARALTEDNKSAEAETHVRKALELEPEGALAHTLLGSVLQGLGKIEEAGQEFRRSIQISPVQGSAYSALTSNIKVTEADRPLVAQMLGLVNDVTLSVAHKSQLHYALGKAFEDLREFEKAMVHFDVANEMAYEVKFGSRPFDRNIMKSSFDFTIQTFTRELLNRNRASGVESGVPIFVVGMMRSGTTLAEQILSSHPEVGPAGEQRFWSDNRNVALSQGSRELNPVILKRLANQYTNLLQTIAPGKAHVVDKMPSNYVSIGMIHLAFPHAKIIHTTRNPADTCISVYTTPNRTRLEWAHNKPNIAFAYREYLRLMDHWSRVLPAGVMMEVKYEDVVSDRERITREMVEFCGLGWDEACLSPERNVRSVVTPSVWQVRQPVYRSSLERWRNYEPWLGEFKNLLA